MKKIEFKNIISPDGRSLKIDENRWRILIGSKTEISFKNQKHAVAFQAKINEELNDTLFTYNDISIELYRHYKTNWFYFNINLDHSNNERKIRNAFSEIERLMEKVVAEYEQYRIMANISHLTEYLITVAKSLQSLQRHRECYAEVRSLELIISRIKKRFETVESLGWNPVPAGGEIVRCEPLYQLNVREQRKKLEETLYKRSLKD
jgi:virulence-associated protein VapD